MKKVMLTGLLLLVLAGFLVTTGCNSQKFDINGTWVVTVELGGEEFSEVYSFLGDRGGGEVLYNGVSIGTYSVSGDSVSFTLEYYDQDDDYTVEVYRGTVDDDDQMSGNFTYTVEGYSAMSGTWIAER